MGWIKLDHVLINHPRVVATPEAFGLYCQGLLYSDFQSTDGFIADHIVPTLLPGLNARKLRARLVEVGLWEEVEGGVSIYAYLKHNRSSEEMEDLKQKRAAAGSKGGSVRQANAKQVLKQTPSKPVKDVQPEKNRIEESREESKSVKLQAAPDNLPKFEDFWNSYPRQPNGTKPEPKKAREAWSRLKPIQKQQALDSLTHYKRHLEQNEYQAAKHAFRYLRDNSFEGYVSVPNTASGGSEDDDEYQIRRLIARAGN